MRQIQHTCSILVHRPYDPSKEKLHPMFASWKGVAFGPKLKIEYGHCIKISAGEDLPGEQIYCFRQQGIAHKITPRNSQMLRFTPSLGCMHGLVALDKSLIHPVHKGSQPL